MRPKYISKISLLFLFFSLSTCFPIFADDNTVVNIAKCEYFIDTDPGIGLGEELSVAEGDNNYSLSLNEIAPGAHIFGLRVVDDKGRWTQTVVQPLYIVDEMLYADMEYFIDEDPGKGNGQSVNHGHKKIINFNIVTKNLSIGTHTLSVRLLDPQGKWGEVMTRPFVVMEKIAETDLILEYFYDEDPGVGLARRVAVAEGENVFFLPLDGLEAGAHIFGVRCLDKEGLWSSTIVNPLYLIPRINMAKAEYFVDKDPGEGNGIGVAIGDDGKSAFSIATDRLVEGTHNLVLRGMLDNEEWITLFSRPFDVVSDGSGISSVKWRLGLTHSKTSTGIKLEGNEIPEGSSVSLVTLEGQSLADVAWDDPEKPLYLDFDYPGLVIIQLKTPHGEASIKILNH